MIVNLSSAPQPANPELPRLVNWEAGTIVECSVMQPSGDGVRDVGFLLREPTADLSRWYDTYDGDNAASPEWYALYLAQEQEINSLFFVHGPMFLVGGWWTMLQPQYLDSQRQWQNVTSFTITPTYDFRNERGNRQPYTPFQISFPSVRTRGIRLFGQPGGVANVTTMTYLAAGMATPAQAAAYLQRLQSSMPKIFTLLPPNKLWDLMASIRDVTRIMFDVQSSEGLGLEHYLDEQRFKQFQGQNTSVYDSTSLYQLLGSHEGWDQFGLDMQAARKRAVETRQPIFHEHHGGMVWIVVPVIVDGETIGTIENRNFVCCDQPDAGWHTAAAHRFGIDAQQYAPALKQIPTFDVGWLESVVQLLGHIVDLSQQQIQQGLEVNQLRSTVEELAAPVLPVWKGVLTVPLVGRIDEQRAQQIMMTILHQVSQQRTQIVIVDITGVATMDTTVVAYLARLAQSTQLLGARCFLSGVQQAVAMTLVTTGAMLGNVRTFASLQAALAVAIETVEGKPATYKAALR